MSLISGQIKIGSTTLTKLIKCDVTLEDGDVDSERNAKYSLIRNRVAQVPQIELEFAPQTKTEMEALLNLLKPALISVTYYCPQSQSEKTANFYANTHTPSIIGNNPVVYDKMQVTLIGYSGI